MNMTSCCHHGSLRITQSIGPIGKEGDVDMIEICQCTFGFAGSNCDELQSTAAAVLIGCILIAFLISFIIAYFYLKRSCPWLFREPIEGQEEIAVFPNAHLDMTQVDLSRTRLISRGSHPIAIIQREEELYLSSSPSSSSSYNYVD